MTPTEAGIYGFIVLVALMFLKIPVGFVMALVGLLGFAFLVSWDAALNLMAQDFSAIFGSYNLTVIPLFVLMGQMAHHSGMSGRLFHAAYRFFGNLPGGLAVATIGACAGFSAICGSTSATAATMAAVALPEMKKYNYDPALATGVVAAGGSLGILIPPSTIFIVYGIMTEQSVGKLFLAGVMPGILMTILFIVTVLLWTWKRPDLAMPGARFTLREKIASLAGVVETLILFVAVMGGLFIGFFTPTEAAAIGAFGTLLIAVVGRHLSWKGFTQSLVETTRVTCMILVIVAGATVFGHFLAVTRIPFDVGNWVMGLQMPPWAVMGLIILVYLAARLPHGLARHDHADDPHLFPRHHGPGLRPDLVRRDHRARHRHGSHHAPRGDQRLRRRRGGPRRAASRHLPGSAQASGRTSGHGGTAHPLSADRPVAAAT